MRRSAEASTLRVQRVRMMACAATLLTVLCCGVFGYRLIEGWPWIDCLYMTVITVSTVGFREVGTLSISGKVFTVLLIAGGVGTAAYAISVVLQSFFQRQWKSFMEKRNMQKNIEAVTGHMVVCGYGRMGRNIVSALEQAGRTVVVIDMDAKTADEVERSGRLVVMGDATEEEALEKAGILRADALVATLDTDANNLFLILTARGMRQDLPIIARAEDERSARKFTQAGATRVVSPFASGASHIVRLLTRPDVVDFIELVAEGDDIQFEVFQIQVDAESEFAGKTLAEARVRQKAGGMVLAMRKAAGRMKFYPSADARIEAGDLLFVVGSARSKRGGAVDEAR